MNIIVVDKKILEKSNVRDTVLTSHEFYLHEDGHSHVFIFAITPYLRRL